MPISRIKSDGINDASITTAKLADSAVNSAKIGVDVIAAEDLAANSVTVSEISNGAVTSAKLDTNIAIAGNFTVDTGTLHVDASQNCVGIKTTSLTNEASLVVNGGGVRIGAGGHPGTYGDNSLIYDYDTSTGRSRFWSVGNGSTKGEYEFHFRDSSAESALVYMKEGWVGINEPDPEAGLHIKDGDNTQNALVIESDAGGGRKWGFRPGDPVAPSNGYFTIRDETAGENRILIADNGRLALGEFTSSPTARVHCNKYSDYSEHALKVEQSSGTVNFNTRLMEMKVNSAGAEVPYINFYGGAAFLGRIRSNTSSNGMDYTTASDYRLKENVTSITGAIDSVKQLNPISFNFISNPDITTSGFLAHEVQDIVSEAVGGVKDAVDEDNNPIYQDLDAGKLIPLLTAALKDAITKIESLEERIAVLENA